MIEYTILHILFYIMSAGALISALFVISLKNPVHSVLALVVTFFAMAGNWMLLRAEFLSLILILVYVGAVMTLFLFVVMMLNIDKEDKRAGFVNYLPFGVILMLIFIGLLITGVSPKYFGIVQMPAPGLEPSEYSNVTMLARLLFNQYVYPFEIAGVLLLAAIIAAITLAHRSPQKRHVQSITAQVEADPAQRVRLVNMKADKGEK